MKIIPFLMNFSSEESCATRMSISPIIFLIGVHSHGIPVQATDMFRILQFDKLKIAVNNFTWISVRAPRTWIPNISLHP